MNAVLLGICKDSLSLANMIKNAPNYPLNGIYIDGVYCKDVSKTASCASALGISAYTTPDAAIRNADILFISCNDSELSAYSEFIKEFSIRNKILCHFSRKYDSSVLSCGVTNSVYSIRFPYKVNMEKLPLNATVIFEGQGRHHQLFKTAIEGSLRNVTFCTKEENMLSFLANRFATGYIKNFVNMSRQLYKFAGIYSEDEFKQMLLNLASEIALDNSNPAPLEPMEAKKLSKLLSSLNYSDTKDCVLNMETHIVENSNCSYRERDELLKILKHKKR